MKRRCIAALLMALLLLFQLIPFAYAGKPDLPDSGYEEAVVSDEHAADIPLDEGAKPKEPSLGKENGEARSDVALSFEAAACMQTTPTEAANPAGSSATEVKATLKVTGLTVVDGFVETETWLEETLFIHSSKDAMTASLEVLNQKGLRYTTAYGGTMLDSLTKGSTTLSSAQLGKDFSYWEFFVNGVSSGEGAVATYPQEGVVWEWRYNDGAQAAFADKALEVKITGVESIGGVNIYAPWLDTTKYYDPSKTALEATCAVLKRNAFTYTLTSGTWLDSITKPDGTILGTTGSGNEWSYWSFLFNGEYAQSGAGQQALAPGDSIEFKYSMSGKDAPLEVLIDPDAARPQYASDNAGFTANRVVDSQTPTTAHTTELAFKNAFKASTDWETGYSDVLLVNNNIYLAVGQNLLIISGATGTKLAEVQLANPIGYTCRPLYTQGLIVVPLEGGRLQAFTADTLTCVWLTEVLPSTSKGSHQNNSTLIKKEGYLYYGTSVSDWNTSFAGTFLCIDARDGRIVWQAENATSGFYWAGAVSVGEYIYIADDAGTVYCYHAQEGWLASKVSLGTSIRSTLTSDGSYLYAADTTGKLWRMTLGSWGALEQSGLLSYAAGSTSTPVISEGRLFVGGNAADYTGVLAVVDLNTFTLEHSISVPAPVQSTPLVVNQGAATYVYFTCNKTPGGIYCYRLGERVASEIYTPLGDDANYCMSSVVAASDGLLYYTNDSGNLFALRLGTGTGENTTGNANSGQEITAIEGLSAQVFTSFIGRRAIVRAVDASTQTTKDTASVATNSSSNSAASPSRQGTSTSVDLGEEQATPTAWQTTPLAFILSILGILLAIVGLIIALVWYRTSKNRAGGMQL